MRWGWGRASRDATERARDRVSADPVRGAAPRADGGPRPAAITPHQPKRATGRTQTVSGAPRATTHRDSRERRTLAVPPDILRQVKLLELRTRGLVNSHFVGEYHSVFKGQGMEFSEVREYQPGDEVRSIDWNVTARMRHPFVKRYIEERELTVMLAVDLSGSERFGTARRFKSELATELSAVLAMSAIRNNDRVGALLFTDRVEHVVPPSKGRRHVLRLIRDLLVHEPAGCGTDIPGAIDYLAKMLPNRAIIFIVSDFVDDGIEQPLKILAQRHDVVAVTVEDPRERSLPDVGLARFTDPESGTTVDVDTGDPTVRRRYDERVRAERQSRTQLLRRLAIDEIAVRTDQSYVEPLLRFFRLRETRRRRR